MMAKYKTLPLQSLILQRKWAEPIFWGFIENFQRHIYNNYIMGLIPHAFVF